MLSNGKGFTKGGPWVCRALDQERVCPGFCQTYGAVSRLTKDGPWILWTCKDQQVQSLGLMSLVCIVSIVLLQTCHSLWVECIGDKMAFSYICASYEVAGTVDMV